jgi:hypothetical protein
MSPAYEYIGKNMVQAGGAAASHALSVVSAERGLGLFHEQAVQALFIRWDTVTDAFNAYYGGTHFLVPALTLGWLLPGSFGIADTLRDAGPGHVESTLITTAATSTRRCRACTWPGRSGARWPCTRWSGTGGCGCWWPPTRS